MRQRRRCLEHAMIAVDFTIGVDMEGIGAQWRTWKRNARQIGFVTWNKGLGYHVAERVSKRFLLPFYEDGADDREQAPKAFSAMSLKDGFQIKSWDESGPEFHESKPNKGLWHLVFRSSVFCSTDPHGFWHFWFFNLGVKRLGRSALTHIFRWDCQCGDLLRGKEIGWEFGKGMSLLLPVDGFDWKSLHVMTSLAGCSKKPPSDSICFPTVSLSRPAQTLMCCSSSLSSETFNKFHV